MGAEKPPDSTKQPSGEGFDGFGEEEFEEPVADLKRELAQESAGFLGPGAATWQAATDIVHRVRPVPWLLWTIIRAVYGKSGELGDPPATAFSVVAGLITRAASDRTLAPARREEDAEDKVKSLAEAIQLIGTDVAASLCFVHAVCRRVGTGISERVWRPIIDDALLRAHIGYHVGQLSTGFGPGRGMLAGFAGRCGLAVQIAAGTIDQAQKALAGLASGIEIGQICREVYRCDPLQVAALSLIAGGCSRDIAMGIAAFSNQDEEILPGSEQHRWLTVFTVIEHVRMGKKDLVPQSAWDTLSLDAAAINDLLSRVQQVQRRGHGWRWITQSLLQNQKDDKNAADESEPVRQPRRMERSQKPGE